MDYAVIDDWSAFVDYFNCVMTAVTDESIVVDGRLMIRMQN